GGRSPWYRLPTCADARSLGEPARRVRLRSSFEHPRLAGRATCVPSVGAGVESFAAGRLDFGATTQFVDRGAPPGRTIHLACRAVEPAARGGSKFLLPRASSGTT